MTNSNSSISKHYHQLNSERRGQIQALLDSGITSCTAIAQEVGCYKSTISREIRQGSVIAAMSCMSTITLILHKFIMKSAAETAISVIH
ncbi:MAG: helix-turn-helix domain-containing protein [Lactobacillus crispatus]|jgi:IS30 family transposase|nr:helix-turn-helix domain-containing protein [Lactobacillus crispatus]MCI1336219.1 helix-turn-helix domain-containing protein [Lactobacillus crispatus]MCI1365494.1 helix-turn-helix domain-containing protein [Lactobacillus crispatus]MCI1494123.1 helix-turn-helix domain-containing protein [Lactobacillus crispatus]MCI1524395.1 helix-turn-helix domain-containing protein [Lactobacillus crispatus]